VKNTLYAAMEFSRCTPAPKSPAKREKAARRQVSQNSAVLLTQPHGQSPYGLPSTSQATSRTEVDVILGELVTGRIHHGRAAPGVKRSGFPRKEVIQPQLPLRLPCYDFTPVTNPTFDGFLPCGLEHRLRVLPASVM
jgi:hypothetical protein